MADPAMSVKDAVAAHWRGLHPKWKATLEVADDYQPLAGSPTLLVADDGGGMLNGGAWLIRRDLMRIDIRMTAFAKGRSEARTVLTDAIDIVVTTKPPGICPPTLPVPPAPIAQSSREFRGNHLSNATCLTHVSFNSYE